ncbi:MAG: hypothetical protein E4G92_00670 [Bacteroidia bacterium]|nr:MAG: hypothetical protein E4G92_00670 [Bacteroidia bacterium]
MRDFTLKMFALLVDSLKREDYSFLTYEESLSRQGGRFVILRHDVDRSLLNALRMARLERRMGIAGSYYFREGIRGRSTEVIREIVRLGHEAGYHYENLSAEGGDMEAAIASFRRELAFFRQFYPVTTICMHGSPLSKHDNRLLWVQNDYRDHQILAEPYFDLDITDTLYISDTGRRWDGDASIRDRSGMGSVMKGLPGWDKWAVAVPEKSMIRIKPGCGALHELYSFRGTEDIMAELAAGRLPERIMINIHPQRWDDNYLKWFRELVSQNIKNDVKRIMLNKRDSIKR